MLAVALLAAVTTADQERELPMPPWAFGVISLAVFAALLAVTYAFRSVGRKHSMLSEGA